jgi:hypothetical protein
MPIPCAAIKIVAVWLVFRWTLVGDLYNFQLAKDATNLLPQQATDFRHVRVNGTVAI